MRSRKKSFDNEEAVSVLVGTLGLILVVVIGISGIAVIYSAYSSDVAKQLSPHQSVISSQIPLVIAGSDTMQITTYYLGDDYMKRNLGVKISGEAVSTNAMISSLDRKAIDLGAVSGKMDYTIVSKNPNLNTKLIGETAVVVITNKASPGVTSISVPVQYSDLKTFFTGGAGGGNIKVVATRAVRSDSSATTDTFYNFLGSAALPGDRVSDADMIQYVAATQNAIGYADYSDVESSIANNGVAISIVPICDQFYCYPGDFIYSNMSKAAKYNYLSTATNFDNSPMWTGDQSYVPEYNMSLYYPMYYVWMNSADPLGVNFMQYAISPAAVPAFAKAYTFPIVGF